MSADFITTEIRLAENKPVKIHFWSRNFSRAVMCINSLPLEKN